MREVTAAGAAGRAGRRPDSARRPTHSQANSRSALCSSGGGRTSVLSPGLSSGSSASSSSASENSDDSGPEQRGDRENDGEEDEDAGAGDSSPEDESTLKCVSGATWVTDGSSSGLSSSTSTSSDEDEVARRSLADRSTTGCGGDFQWLRTNRHPDEDEDKTARKVAGVGAVTAEGGRGGGRVASRHSSLERGRARRVELHHDDRGVRGGASGGCCVQTACPMRRAPPPPFATLPLPPPPPQPPPHDACCFGGPCCRHSYAAPWETCCPCRSRSLCRWERSLPASFVKPASDVEERVRRLEADKDSLQLQVTVLSEQIEVQTEKITDLEKALEEKKHQLNSAENMLQTEMLARSSLETHKLELLSAISELKLHQASLERENLDLRERLSEERRRNKPPLAPRSVLHATSTPFTSPAQNAQLLVGASPSPSPVSSMSDGSPRRVGIEEIPQPRTPPANYRRKVDHYGSLPRQRTGSGSSIPPLDTSLLMSSSRKGVAFGKGLSSLLPFHPQTGRRVGADKSFSTPNLAETERVVIEDHPALQEEVDGTNNFSPEPSPSLHPHKSKGIKKIFGRIKRSNSGTLEDLPGEGEFRRGGVRATAGARLGWGTAPISAPKPDLPFSLWDSEAISQWLQDMGLDCYAKDARRWVKSGAQLLSATAHEIDKELGIKSPLHRKKLQLALLCEAEGEIVKPEDPHLLSASRLDAAWVLRWLDDVGLPQHKEAFLTARVDGRVLHRLTTEDLALLHLSSSLHVASLRRGIQVLREYFFDPNCLLRRSLPDETIPPTPQEVARWTNHRVMEWLRVVDLAEYAPNLRGSGVHGGLMIYEPRFTAELLASLLSIPPSKTLLRRHLNTHFKELLGRDCIQEKREAEATLGYVPLSATTKVKLAKKSQFTLKRKKSKAEMDMGDLVCPLDPSKPDVTCEQSSKGRGCLSGN